MPARSRESIDTEAIHHLDRLLIEMATDRHELIAESGPPKRETQKGLANVAEVIDGLQHLRQALMRG